MTPSWFNITKKKVGICWNPRNLPWILPWFRHLPWFLHIFDHVLPFPHGDSPGARLRKPLAAPWAPATSSTPSCSTWRRWRPARPTCASSMRASGSRMWVPWSFLFLLFLIFFSRRDLLMGFEGLVWWNLRWVTICVFLVDVCLIDFDFKGFWWDYKTCLVTEFCWLTYCMRLNGMVGFTRGVDRVDGVEVMDFHPQHGEEGVSSSASIFSTRKYTRTQKLSFQVFKPWFPIWEHEKPVF